MNIVQITPGAGGMYCGNCFRDNALVAALRDLGHSVLMVPLYLPLTLDEADQSSGVPIFFSGLNVYLAQQSPLFRRIPKWLHQSLASPRLLGHLSRLTGNANPAGLGELTLSMLRGEEGNQAREVETLVQWLESQPRPDVICLSNALLLGMARRLRDRLQTPVACMLQGEDAFLDALPEPHRRVAWEILRERAREIDLFITPSAYYRDRMSTRLDFSSDRICVVYNGINLDGFTPATSPPAPPVIGFFARMCPEKGLDSLVDAFITLKKRDLIPNLKLRVGGGLGPAERPFVQSLKKRLRNEGFIGDTEFFPNLTRDQKLEFFRSLTVLSTPALYGEAFGLYVIEALATGVPVVQPRHGAFPELVDATGGGVLYNPEQPDALADALQHLLTDAEKARALGREGFQVVHARFGVRQMAGQILETLKMFECTQPPPHGL